MRKAHEKLDWLEKKYLKKQREITKALENPFRAKLKRKTLLGVALSAGVKALDKKISRSIKNKTTVKLLPE